MAEKFELLRSSDNQTYFNLKAANGEIILTSELYTSKGGAENGIESVKTNAPIDARYDRRTSVAGEPYFVLKAANGEIIGRSEMYSSESARDNGIQSVKTNAPGAAVEDLTGSAPRQGKFEIKRSSDNQFYFNLKAGNGEVILTSEMYTAKSSAQNGIDSVKTNAPNDSRFERKTSSSNDPYFVLEAVNGETIGVSEMYSSESARDNGIQSVKNNAPSAEVVDLS